MLDLRIGSLFAGIGGLELGLERAGLGHVVWQVEIDPFACQVLERHWPDVQRFGDVRAVGAHNLPAVEILCGGFPCEDVSSAGKRAGVAKGKASGLWREFARLVGELRPRFVVVENVAALTARGRGLDRVLGDLAALGYDAEWDCIPAPAVGAPHRQRDRVFIVAYPREGPGPRPVRPIFGSRCPASHAVPDAHGCGQSGRPEPHLPSTGGLEGPHGDDADRLRAALADADGRGRVGGPARLGPSGAGQGHVDEPVPGGPPVGDADGSRRQGSQELRPWAGNEPLLCLPSDRRAAWTAEPDVGRVANGVPDRVHRLRVLGKAVIPQVGEFVGRCIRGSLT